MSKARRSLYQVARVLGDVEAAGSGKPARVGKRLVNKLVGRKVVRRLWWR